MSFKPIRSQRNKEEEEVVVPTPSTPPYINTTVKQFPKRTSPLASTMIAPGHYLTTAGTVAPIPKPPVIEEEEEE